MLKRNTSAKKALDDFILKTLKNMGELVYLMDAEGPIIISEIEIKDGPSSNTEDTVTSMLLRQIGRFEPRLELIGAVLKQITRQVTIYDDKKNIREPTGFKLKNPAQWVTTEKMDPYHGDIEWDVLKYISNPCAVQCEFCLHKSDPPGYYTSSNKWSGNWEEIKERIKHFDPTSKTAIFSEFDYGSYEKLSHPKFFAALDLIRKKTNRVITLITNGESLHEAHIRRLKNYRPVLVVLSLNSFDKKTRKKAMKDHKADIAINALSLLHSAGIPFVISLTHWYESPLGDLAATIEYADRFSPYFIRVNLEAYSKYHPLYGKYNLHEHWLGLVKTVREKRSEITTPIVFQPVLFEENLYREETHPVIRGIVKNSPAFFAGLKNDDIILEIEGKKIKYRQTAKDVLRLLLKVKSRIMVKIRRDADEFNVELLSEREAYPSFPFLIDSGMGYPWGIVMSDSLRPEDINRLKKILEEHKGKTVLLLTSTLVNPSIRYLIKELGDSKIFERLHTTIPKNSFLGEEIIIGDLLTVKDMITSVNNWVKKEGVRPDLVIVPSTPFTPWKKDIAGDSLHNLEREVKIPIKLLRTERIWAMGG